MTYDSRETSIQSGEPIELYQFVYGENIYRFTSAKQAATVLNHTWYPELLQRDNIDFSAEKGRNNLKIKTVRDMVIADLFRVTPPSTMIILTVFRMHVGDGDIAVIWSGRLLAVEFSGSSATLTCEPLTTSLKRTGLRRLYQRQCPHVLYGNACRANQSAFAVPVTLSGVAGVTLTSATFGLYANDYFSGGYFDFVNDGVIERRFITEHKGSQVKMNLPLFTLESGRSITVYAGCDHTMSTCQNKFNNLNNYGGFPYIPQKNPFGTNGIY